MHKDTEKPEFNSDQREALWKLYINSTPSQKEEISQSVFCYMFGYCNHDEPDRTANRFIGRTNEVVKMVVTS